MAGHLNVELLQRSHDEIDDMCKTMRESLTHGGTQYERLSYEEGCIAVIKWLFFSTGEHPGDITKPWRTAAERVSEEIARDNIAQAKEGSDT